MPGSRPHIPIDPHEPVEAIETFASNYPVFRVLPTWQNVKIDGRTRAVRFHGLMAAGAVTPCGWARSWQSELC